MFLIRKPFIFYHSDSLSNFLCGLFIILPFKRKGCWYRIFSGDNPRNLGSIIAAGSQPTLSCFFMLAKKHTASNSSWTAPAFHGSLGV